MRRHLPQHRFVLASSSSYRLDLLRGIGVEPSLVVASNVDESELKREKPKDYVVRVARAKLDSVVATHPDCCVLSADTIAFCHGGILHKTDNIEEARKSLLKLSGRRHRVCTCVCLYSALHKSVRSRLVETVVSFKRLSKEELECYLQSGQWKNKAGCYGVQGLASVFVRWMRGSFHNIVGLPLHELNSLLCWAGFGLKE